MGAGDLKVIRGIIGGGEADTLDGEGKRRMGGIIGIDGDLGGPRAGAGGDEVDVKGALDPATMAELGCASTTKSAALGPEMTTSVGPVATRSASPVLLMVKRRKAMPMVASTVVLMLRKSVASSREGELSLKLITLL